ncbi:MAG TPA: WYL domain-containing protein [Verrucomicrobiae bacterium]|nr:WYL domain-containing protein [Verrucomicrobiae bacterium]
MRQHLPLPEGASSQERAPSEHVARIGWLLLSLMCHGSVEYALYRDRFGKSKRRFQDDLKKIREIGQGRFIIPGRTKGGRALLQFAAGARIPEPAARIGRAYGTLSNLAVALGGAFEQEIHTAVGSQSRESGVAFLQLRGPKPSMSERVAQVYSELESAASGPAMIEFSYRTNRGDRSMRRVEPYLVFVRAGRYYLVAYDLARRDWRQFALDAILGKLTKVGTFPKRAVPPRYLSDAAVGWITGNFPSNVTYSVSPLVAAAVTSQRWQADQRVVSLPDGAAEITLAFCDVGEAVRWAMQFAPEVIVKAPPEVVSAAEATAQSIAIAYQKLRKERSIAG